MSSIIEGKIAIYACGGAGISIVSHFERFRNKIEPNGYGQVIPTYIDTTLGDITEKLPRESIFVFEHTDGSGKVRAENNDLIKENTNKILQTYKPGDINIVVSSLSGGSGATFAGHLTIGLLKRKLPTIVIAVASRDSRVEVENTIKSIKTYEKAAHITQMPVVMSYWLNDDTTPRENVDKGIQELISSLSALFSRHHRRLDTADLANWLNYPKINPSLTPRLVTLDRLDKEELADTDCDVISVATLAREGQSTTPGVPVEYQAVGYVQERFLPSITIENPVHFCIVDNAIPKIFSNLEKDFNAFTEARRAKPASKPVARFNDDEDDDIVI